MVQQGFNFQASGNPSNGGIVYSLDFRRIEGLPRKRWSDVEFEERARALTRRLKTAQGSMSLRGIQAAALTELETERGMFGSIAVGAGKSLIAFLAPTVLRSERPLLLVPAQLRDIQVPRMLEEMRQHWNIVPNLRVVGYSELSLAKNNTLLEDYSPDLIIMDECHYLKNLKSGRTRRVQRYLSRNNKTMVVALSGTVASRSIMDYWHIAHWALQDGTPLPMGWNEAKEWAMALDEKVSDEDRRPPGALRRLGTPPRDGYRRRLVETPGVVATSEDRIGTSLILKKRGDMVEFLPREIKQKLSALEDSWVGPDGEPISEAMEVWRIARQLVSGFYYRWQEEPPRPWLQARREWNSLCRHTLRRSRTLDTELQVWNKHLNSTRPPHEWLTWKEIKTTYAPKTEAVWIDEYLVYSCCDWLSKNRGICWVEHTAVGERISRRSGVPYMGAGNTNILEWGGPVVASIRAHGTGKNLQQYSKNLVACPPSNGKTWEQLLGRTHRQGQPEEEVSFELFLHAAPFVKAFEDALLDAKYLEETLGQEQRLLYADREF